MDKIGWTLTIGGAIGFAVVFPAVIFLYAIGIGIAIIYDL